MRQKRSLWGLSFVAVALVAASACSDQAEGARCDQKNGNSDCESGLLCRSDTTATGAGICCPPDGSPIGVAICRPISPGVPEGGAPQTTPDSGGSKPPIGPIATDSGALPPDAHTDAQTLSP